MHESSLVAALLRQVQRIAADHPGQWVERIDVEIGPLSGVEPELFARAFQRHDKGDDLAGAQLKLDVVGLSAVCQACTLEFEPSGFRFRCPNCGGPVRITRGDGFLLKSITMKREG